MALRVHDSLTGRLQELTTLEPGVTRVYTCGPTVWNYPHIGNYRTFLFYDLLRRHLSVSGYRLQHVTNVTDVDDRIIARAAEAGMTIGEYTATYTDAYFEDLATLRAQPAEWNPRATDHVPDMIRLIESLLDAGHAYQAEDGVYFRIASFPGYGALSHLDREGLRVGARVASDDYDKEAATDFALWKRATDVDERVGAAWDASFGRGRPGWHIECSAMAMRYLGETLDIHAGGIDLRFPHHENEIAQSESATRQPFARYWLHAGHVTLALGEKMSKRLGNFVTLRDLLEDGWDAAGLRLYLLASAHYRRQLQLSEEGMHSAREQVRRLRDLSARLHATPPADVDDGRLVAAMAEGRARYRAALDDDLNLPTGLGVALELVREANTALDAGAVGRAGRAELRGLLGDVDAHLDVLCAAEDALPVELQALIDARQAARERRDWAEADRIRDRLQAEGIAIEDTAQGPRWRRVGRG
jgi:cysteinyl-tRNA synthetase